MSEQSSFPRAIDDGFEKATKFLLENNIIGVFTHRPDKHPRYINLLTQIIFDNLVDLYANAIFTQLHHYKRLLDSNRPPIGVPPHIYAARCYISIWFIDLYVSNRKAVMELSSSAFIERYQGELSQISNEYDHYLTLVNASIRPTYLKYHIDNALQIPIITDSTDVNNQNPFGINNFTYDVKFFFGITRIMKDTNRWHFMQLSSDPMGRPCWLFDWHSENRVCSWFLEKDNYDHVDVTLAYILGTACTSNLGARDTDDWQFFADDIVPQNPNPSDYDRVEERSFFGSYEVRTMEIDLDFSLAQFLGSVIFTLGAEGSKRSTEFETSGEVSNESGDMSFFSRAIDRALKNDQLDLVPRFMLNDWVYRCPVILNMDEDTRIKAHSGFLLDRDLE